MTKTSAKAVPYIRTTQMTQVLEPSWASAGNAVLAAAVARMETLRLPELTVRLDFAHVAAAPKRHEVAPHLHSQMELFRVESGEPTFYAGETRIVLQQGDIGIMPARTIHRWVSGNSTTVYLGLTLTAEPACEKSDSLGYQLRDAAAALGYRMKADAELSRAFDTIWNETQKQRPDSAHVCAAYAAVAITLAFRQLREAVNCTLPTNTASCNDRYVLAAQAYIRAHLSEPMSVQNIADSIGISARHLNRIISASGLGSIGKCIERTRIEHAQWLLRRSQYPVKTIAKLCGYCDTPYFSRAFKNFTGRPPSEVRNSGGNKLADAL